MTPSPGDKTRLMKDIDRNARTLPLQMANWIADTRRVTELVAAGNTDLIPVFWIRLYGVLTDISDHLVRTADAEPRVRTLAGISAEEMLPLKSLVESLARLRDVFSEEGLIYLQYLRHVDSHPVQDRYRIRVSKKGSLLDQIHHKLLGQPLSVEETTAAILSVLRRFDIRETSVAHEFARRALPEIENVRIMSLAWFGEARSAHLTHQAK